MHCDRPNSRSEVYYNVYTTVTHYIRGIRLCYYYYYHALKSPILKKPHAPFPDE